MIIIRVRHNFSNAGFCRVLQGLSCTGWSFFFDAGFELYWVERFFLTQGLLCSARGFAGFGLIPGGVFFFDAGFAVFCAAFRRV